MSLASNDSLRSEITEYMESRFGVPPTAFDGAALQELGSGEIWIASRDAAAVTATRRPPGLRALRRSPEGLKPTSAFLVSIGPLVVCSRVEMDAAALQSLLLGRRLAADAADGYVALSYEKSVLGCGLVSAGSLRCLVPTGRRQELLGVLADEAHPQAPEM